jgi:DNA repair exonuclease SbcCD ATPase subunit
MKISTDRVRVVGVKIAGFRAYAAADFSPHPESALVAITGSTSRPGFDSNSTGKSSILGAISWAVYGQTLGGEYNAESVIRNGSESAEVSVRLSTGHVITRTRRRGHAAVLRLTGSGGEDLTLGTTPPTERRIAHEVFGCPFSLFRVSAAFAASQDAARFPKLRDGDKRRLLATVLGLDAYADARQRAKDAADAIHRDADAILDKASRIEAKASAIRSQTPPPKPVAPIVVPPPNSATAVIEADPAAVADARRDLADAESASKDATTRYEAVRRKLKAAGGKCPTCGRVPEGFDAAEVERLRRKVIKLGAKADAADMDVSQARRALANAENAGRDARAAAAKHQAKYDAYLAASAACAEALKAWREWERKRAARTDKLSAKASALADKARLRRLDADPFEFWAEHFGPRRLPSHLSDTALAAVSVAATENLRALIDARCEVVLSPTRETSDGREIDEIEVAALIPGFGSRYEDLSTGAQRRVDIAVTLALATGAGVGWGGRWGQLFVDEVFDGVDTAGADRIVRRLRDVAVATGRQVVMVTNDPRLSADADEVWEASHDGDGTATLRRVR